jgi:hypothetical protein
MIWKRSGGAKICRFRPPGTASLSPSGAERLFSLAQYESVMKSARQEGAAILSAAALVFWLAGQAFAASLTDSDCLLCHDDPSFTTTNAAGKVISLFADKAKFSASVHGTNSCVSCHADVTAKHPDDNRPVAPVHCARCHQQQGEELWRQRSRSGAPSGPRGRRHLRGLPWCA